MVRWCCVPDCNSAGGERDGISFHSFPKDEKQRAVWINKIRRDVGESFSLSKHTVVFSKHFMLNDFNITESGRKIVKGGHYPSIFNFKSKTAGLITAPKQARKPPVVRCDSLTQSEEPDLVIVDTPRVDISHDYCVSPQKKSKTETEILRENLEAAQEHIKFLEKQNCDLRSEVDCTKFGILKFKHDDEKIKHFTGFDSYNAFYFVFEYLQPKAKYMTYINSVNTGITGSLNAGPRRKPRTLSLMDEFFLVLCRLRRGFSEHNVACLFDISDATVSRIFTTWINFLYFELSSLPIWPSKELVRQNLPECFKKGYPSTRCIIDATEIRVQAPSSLLCQSQYYSTYKSNTTMKGLVGISPSGAITFVSELFTGSISDKDITSQSGILTLLEPGDTIIADKGFVIDELLEPLAKSGVQMPSSDVLETQSIASVRVFVECAIRRIKTWKILQGVVPLSLHGNINQIWTVCCLLCNFQTSVLGKKMDLSE